LHYVFLGFANNSPKPCSSKWELKEKFRMHHSHCLNWQNQLKVQETDGIIISHYTSAIERRKGETC